MTTLNSQRFVRPMLLMVLALVTLAAAAGQVAAQEAGGPSHLARATQNPVGDLTSVPFQFNFNSGGPLAGRTLYNLDVQPVFPLPLSEHWDLIARTIVPYVGGGRK